MAEQHFPVAGSRFLAVVGEDQRDDHDEESEDHNNVLYIITSSIFLLRKCLDYEGCMLYTRKKSE